MPLRLSVAGHSDVGRVRKLNEDSFYYKVVQASDEDPLGLFIVADGMGGHLAGEVASYWTVQTLKRELAPLFAPRDPAATRRLKPQEMESLLKGERLTVQLGETDLTNKIRNAIERANEVVLGYARKKPEEAGNMGSTVTLAAVHGEQAFVANVGDSRTYLWHNGDLRQLTTDQSVPGALVAAGQLAPEELYDHPQRHIIYNCLGFKEELEVEIAQPLSLQPGDALLLCSDGLWEMVRPTGELAALFAETPDVAATCRRLVDEANKRGGEDNIAVVIARVEG
jgi:serine/threonine protein phosphatase PrpC